MRRRVTVSKRYPDGYRPEVALALGPAGEAVIGAGDFGALYGHVWALLYHDPGFTLMRYNGADYVEAPPSDALAPLPGCSHIALAWDVSARPVLACERAGGIYIRQWDAGSGGYVERGPFAGHDPVLVQDAVAHRKLAQADVALFHTDPARRRVLVRLQRDQYQLADEYYTGTDIGLDQAAISPWRIVLFGTDAGEPLTLAGGYYPLDKAEALPGPIGAASIGGRLEDVVLVLDPVAEALPGPIGAASIGGRLEEPTTYAPAEQEALPGPVGAASIGGRLETVVLVLDAVEEALPGPVGAASIGGRLETVVLVLDAVEEALPGPVGAASIGGRLEEVT